MAASTEHPADTIRRYIHARNGVWVDIAEPQTATQWQLFLHALNVARQWFANEGAR